MKRRDLLKLTAVVAATVPAAAAQEKPKADWTPSVFDDHQNQTVIALSDLIIPATDTPGAKAAQVNRYIDLFLRDGKDTERVRFLEGLNWLDGYALRLHGHSFVACEPAQQIAILEALDTGKAPDLNPGHRFFRMVKGFTTRVYYSTRIGYEEMNKGGRVPATFGCQHPEH